MKIKVYVKVVLTQVGRQVRGEFQGILTSPCMYRAGEQIEFPEIENSDPEDCRVTIKKVVHRCPDNFLGKVTIPKVFCEFGWHATAQDPADLLETELSCWTENTLRTLKARLDEFASIGFEEIENIAETK